MKIKRDYNRIIDEIKKIHPVIIHELNYYLFQDLEFIKIFPDFKGRLRAQIVDIIIHKNKRYDYRGIFEKIIKKNNELVKTWTFKHDTRESIRKYIIENTKLSDTVKLFTTDVLLLHYFSKHIFQGEVVEILKEYIKKRTLNFEEEKRIIDEEHAKCLKVDLGGNLKDSEDEERLIIYLNELDDPPFKEGTSFFDIGKDFFCEYDEENKVFNNVKRGILYYLKNGLEESIHVKEIARLYYDAAILELQDISLRRKKSRQLLSISHKLQEQNYLLKKNMKTLKQQNKKLNQTILNKIDKSSNKDLENRLFKQKKENYYLQSRIEKLEEQVAVFEEEKRLNTELSDNITIAEKPVTRQKDKPEFMNIVVLGGRWTSDNRKKIVQYLPDNEIEFIEADKTLRNFDKIANSDLIFFDTSYNGHAYYYKVKKCSGDFYHINASNLLEFEKIYEGE